MKGSGKSWNYLGYVLEADTVMQVQMPKFAKISSDFICIYEKNRWWSGLCCLSLYLNIAGIRHGPGKYFCGCGKSWKFL